MAKLIRYESFYDGNVYFECGGCLASGMQRQLSVCPNCGRIFSGVRDEVETTHHYNEALKAYRQSPENRLLREDLYWWTMRCLQSAEMDDK